MSDRPSKTTNTPPENDSPADAWRAPQVPGGWHVPQAAEETVGWRPPERREAEQAGWRVPALPQDMDIVPDNAGAWHLPKPEDTTFKPDDEIEVTVASDGDGALTAETEVALEIEDEASEEEIRVLDETGEATPETGLPFDEVETTAVERGETSAGETVEADSPLPFGPEAGQAPAVKTDAPADDALPFETEDAAEPAESDTGQLLTPALVVDEDDESDDTFSMSELIALASLVEDGQPASGVSAPSVPAPAAPATTEAEPTDPAEYARRQLERLQAGESAAPSVPSVTPAPSSPSAEDPAEYARRQLERLGQTPSEPAPPAPAAAAPVPAPAPAAAPVPAAPALTPAETELVGKYRATEDKVRVLRERYRSGALTRDQFQAELRGLMVLDEAQNWWMMGVESDNWYKYANGQWVPATPEPLAKARAADSAASAPDIQLPNLPGGAQEQETAPAPSIALDEGQTIRTVPVTDDDYMPLPRAVPVRDPDFTLPGTAGVYIPPTPSNLEVTQPMGATVPSAAIQSGATVPSRPIGDAQSYAPGVSVPAPGAIDPSAPPAYEIADVPSPTYRRVKDQQRSSTMRTVLIIAVIGFALLFLIGACGIVGGVAYYSSLAAPYQEAIAGLANYQPQFQTARILDAEGNVIIELTSQEGGAREKIALRDMSPFLIHAVVATENERFFDDPGWDPIAIGRAIIQNFTAGDVQSGASTITQQVARNLILHDTTVSAERKLQEIVIASEIAQRYDKNFILELYLNEVFLGNRSYGVEAASQFYFDKSAADLNMAEAAMLAGIIQLPATYDPVTNPQAAFDRMDTVLGRMRQQGCLQFQHEPYLGEPFCIEDGQIRLNSEGEIVGGEILIERAIVETSSFEPREYQVRYPHFVNFVQAQVEQAFGAEEMFRRGFTIRTTLIPRLQESAETALARQIQAARSTGINSGAVLITDPTTGAIRAMVGSPDFNDEAIDGQVNNVLAWHQPGSSIKPIVYAAALEGVNNNGAMQYWTPATILWDVPTTYNTTPAYTPTNYDRQYHGPVALRYALQNSYNVTAVKALEFIGLDKFREVATRMGLRFLEDATFGLPSALGANEVRLYDHVQAYGALANGGQRVPLFAITSITDADGNQVQLPERPQPEQVISPQIAFIMSNILADNEARASAFGLNSGLSVPGFEGLIAAKTGTTNDATDLWTMGYTTNAVVGVWTGTVHNEATNATTSSAAIPIFNEIMRTILGAGAPQPFANPGGVVQAQICADTGTAFDPNQNCANARTELFIQNQPPPPANQAFVLTAAVDTWTGFRANQYCSENVETRTFVNITDPAAVQWLQTGAGAAYAQTLGLPSEVQALPAQECSPNTPLPNIRMTAPTEGQQVQGNVQIVGSAQAQNFNRYQIEVASLNSPDQWTIVAGPITNQVPPGGTLAQWDTTQVPNGLYRLRLAAFASDGGYVYRTVQVGVNNPLPTATPIPTTQIIPPTTDFSLTPLPFDGQAVLPATVDPAAQQAQQAQPTAVPPPTLEVPGL